MGMWHLYSADYGLFLRWARNGNSRVNGRESSHRDNKSHNLLCGQAIKGARWMLWRQEAMKDVVKLRKAPGSRWQAVIRRSLNGETPQESCPENRV